MQSSAANFDFLTVVFALIHGFKVVIVGMQKSPEARSALTFFSYFFAFYTLSNFGALLIFTENFAPLGYSLF